MIASTLFDDLASWPARVAAIAVATGVIWRLMVKPVVKFGQRWLEVMDKVEHEFKPNNGASMRDGMDRIETGMAGVRAELGEVRDELIEVRVRLDDHDKRFDALEEALTVPPKKKAAT